MRQKTPPPIPIVPPAAPEHLSERSKELWTFLVGVGEKITTPPRRELLIAALEARDRAEQCRRTIEQEGMVTITARSGVGHPHPLLKTERESQSLFVKIMVQLGLNHPGAERWGS